jgi:type IV secretory pathway VirB6-like protein
MTNVNPIDGIKYGFQLMGYVVAVFVVGFIIMGVGGLFANTGSAIIGGLVVLVGFLTFFAGFAGVQYKIIADGVEKGMNAADSGSTPRSGSTTRSQRTTRQSGQKQSTQQQRQRQRKQQQRKQQQRKQQSRGQSQTQQRRSSQQGESE